MDVAEENSNVAGKGDSNIINTSTRTSGTTSEYDDEYAEYDDEYYEYPDTTYSTDDPQFNHPELTDNTLFEGIFTMHNRLDNLKKFQNISCDVWNESVSRTFFPISESTMYYNERYSKNNFVKLISRVFFFCLDVLF